MRIAVWHNLPSGGGKRALYNHVRGLKKRGHHVEAFCPSSREKNFLPLSELIPEHAFSVPDGVLFDRARRGPSYLIPARIRQSVLEWHCRQVSREITRGKFDILFGNACRFFRTSPIARYSSIPSVAYVGEPNRELYERSFAIPRRESWLRKIRRRAQESYFSLQVPRLQAWESEQAKAFSRVLVNSLFTRETLLRSYGLDSHVCYLGVDTDLFRPRKGECQNYVVSLGTFYFSKGPDRAIRALGCLPKRRRPKLVWIANGVDVPYERQMRRLADSLGVQLKILCGISDSAIAKTLARSRAFLYTPRLEPFGLAPLEASSCQIPVVGIAEGGIRESVLEGQTGLLACDGTPASIAERLGTILERDRFSRELGRNGREWVTKYWNLDSATDRLEAQLHQAILENP